ncbi:MAG: 4Fe-4S dicluster domain-containing protein [Pseudomonadales bacterium]|jgi:NAD-dependent dihydropyrimidine dehydrogenase PreA subunit|nr:hypothetical protein [Gammaproteobacteria bacterium]MDP6025700.1 4Fe-4S dicluster domain-containing protein [Pseudomonadales bacterium]MDP6314815.1 4Fe-4S dicluster domain-containing protein [Pseudomonadales bacterium]MDP7313783.1 4Fe-4S dicluster domain-containing protein [Pseudomonadales bacterium]MDP7575922.1 4Fe-4S dicluster domain-containing protein [Pseudomonadales bacterium]
MMDKQEFGELEFEPKGERTVFGHAKVEIDTELCDGCILCTVICPAALLEPAGKKRDRKSHVRDTQDNCMGCACCEAICQTNAIRVVQSYAFEGYYKPLDRGNLSKPRCF